LSSKFKRRNFYVSSIYGGKHIERYEKFKKDSKVMKKAFEDGNISVKEFNDWIDIQKIRK